MSTHNAESSHITQKKLRSCRTITDHTEPTQIIQNPLRSLRTLPDHTKLAQIMHNPLKSGRTRFDTQNKLRSCRTNSDYPEPSHIMQNHITDHIEPAQIRQNHHGSHRSHSDHAESISTWFGLRATWKAGVPPAGKSHQSRKSHWSSVVRCVSYVEISGKLGMKVAKILRKFFGKF